jgi:hypothetical protein
VTKFADRTLISSLPNNFLEKNIDFKALPLISRHWLFMLILLRSDCHIEQVSIPFNPKESVRSSQCCGSGMFYPGSDFFLIPVPDPNIFSSCIPHEKWNANLLFSCFLWFQEQSLSLSHSQKDPRSGFRKNIPDPQHWVHRFNKLFHPFQKSEI